MMNSKKFLSLIVVGGLLFLFGCAKTSSPTSTLPTATGNIVTEQSAAEWQTYTNETDGFSVQYPGDRTYQENVYGSSVMFFTPTLSGDTLQENIGIMKKALDKDYTLDDYYAITKPELIKLIPGFTELSNETIKINDLDAQKLIYVGTQGTRKLQWEQVYLIKNKAVYILSYTATTSTFADYVQKIDEMVATLEIK
ncbi:MAG: PsbP-related protein [candidate division SR1 bacterium]|nr:PsbP-related protein [candidate division SR1 bacterium]